MDSPKGQQSNEVFTSPQQTDHIEKDEFIELTSEEQERLIEYNQSQAELEQVRGRRILFERAPAETLPFIVYCLAVSAEALFSIMVLANRTGNLLPEYLIIGGAMVLPLFALPGGSFADVLHWTKSFVRNALRR